MNLGTTTLSATSLGSGSINGIRLGQVGVFGEQVGLWTPSQLGASLSLWLDADDASTITESGGLVSQWDDKSGDGNHMTQGTGSAQPTYAATGFNSMPALQFNTDKYLGNSSPSGLDSQGDLFYASVFQITTSSSYRMIMGGRGAFNEAAGANGIPILQQLGTSPQLGIHNTGVAATLIRVVVTDITQGHLATVGRAGGIIGNGGTVTVTASGASSSYSTTGTQTWNSAANAVFQIGGRQQSGTSWLLGSISECIAMQRNATTGEREKVEGYLAHKWDLTADLPASHPYKTVAPQ